MQTEKEYIVSKRITDTSGHSESWLTTADLYHATHTHTQKRHIWVLLG